MFFLLFFTLLWVVVHIKFGAIESCLLNYFFGFWLRVHRLRSFASTSLTSAVLSHNMMLDHIWTRTGRNLPRFSHQSHIIFNQIFNTYLLFFGLFLDNLDFAGSAKYFHISWPADFFRDPTNAPTHRNRLFENFVFQSLSIGHNWNWFLKIVNGKRVSQRCQNEMKPQ